MNMYGEQWNTKQNNVALKKLQKKYFSRTIVKSNCPLAWAPEVLSMLEKINKELGISDKNKNLLNLIFKPKVVLKQVKEKFGYLTVYYETKPAYKSYVDEMIKETEIKLSMKDAYYPIEYLWDASTSYNVDCAHHPDTITLKHGTFEDGTTYTNVIETKYRNTMKSMGMNIEFIKNNADMRKTMKEDPS